MPETLISQEILALTLSQTVKNGIIALKNTLVKQLLCNCSWGHLLVRLCRTRSIGRPPDVENWTKTVLQASLTSVFVQFSPPREL